jgi:Fe-S-cluster containining protein
MDGLVNEIIDEAKEHIDKLIETKLKKVIHDRITNYVEEFFDEYLSTVNKKHGISLELLLRDLPERFEQTRCKGLKKNGTRCTHKATDEGFCRWHVDQKRVKTVAVMNRANQATTGHNHPMSIPYMHDCPACNPSLCKPVETEALKDIAHIL